MGEIFAKVPGKCGIILLSYKLPDCRVRLRQGIMEEDHKSRIRLCVLPHADYCGVGSPHVIVMRAQRPLSEVGLGIDT